MQVERYAPVNKDQRAKDDGESMVADTTKCRRQKWSCVENEKLGGQSCQPKERDHRERRSQRVSAAFGRRRNDSHDPVLEKWARHHAVLHGEETE